LKLKPLFTGNRAARVRVRLDARIQDPSAEESTREIAYDREVDFRGEPFRLDLTSLSGDPAERPLPYAFEVSASW
jgi:hypothetical protein